MIIQLTDVVNKETGNNVIGELSNNRFFNDRMMIIPEDLFQARLGGTLQGLREVFILYFKLNHNTISERLRLRVLNGKFLNFTRGIEIEEKWTDEVEIDVILSIDKKKNADKPLAICFETNPIYGSWVLAMGNEVDWNYAPAHFDYFALIRSSRPTDDKTIELPRFIISPSFGYNPVGRDLRGSVGQPYGRTIKQLKTFACQFTRVKAEVLDDYYNKVSITTPHFVVPYPESVEPIAPFWGTLTDPPRFTKRAENGWYFNTRLSWREAY